MTSGYIGMLADHLKEAVKYNYSNSKTKKEEKLSGIHQHIFLERPLSKTMVSISVLVHQLKKGFSMTHILERIFSMRLIMIKSRRQL
jgi:hypothetical protein